MQVAILLLFFVYSAFRRGTPGEPVECKSWIKLEKKLVKLVKH